MYLLDVNVLIAMADPSHAHHEEVARWFAAHHHEGWATCPLTENGMIRILGNSKYPEGPGSTDSARRLLELFCQQPGHQFWPDNLSLLDRKLWPSLTAQKHLTDVYLLGLAVSRGAKLTTLDHRIEAHAVRGGESAYYLIETGRPL